MGKLNCLLWKRGGTKVRDHVLWLAKKGIQQHGGREKAKRGKRKKGTEE